MKQTLFYVLLAGSLGSVALTSCASSTQSAELYQPQPGTTLKVINYNIWNGFDWGAASESRQLLIETMQERDPDVVALQELCKFNGKKLQTLAEAYGHAYSALLKSSGYPVGITSKYPIEVVKRKTFGLWHGFLHVNIQGVHYVVVHLSPAESAYRKKEADYIIDYLAKETTAETPVILLGDFNAHAQTDEEALLTRPELLAQYQAGDVGKPEDKHNLYNNSYDFRIIETFTEAGYQDAAYLANPGVTNQWTFPTPMLGEKYQGDRVGERIDYQLASAPLAEHVTHAEIIMNETTERVSDHYPLEVIYTW